MHDEALARQLMQSPPTTALRRVKQVQAREVDPHQIEVIDVPSGPPAVPAPLIEPLRAPDAAPAIDPTSVSVRHRKRKHNSIYRMAQATTGMSMCGTALAIILLSLGDGHAGAVTAVSALAVGVVAVICAWRTRLSSRVLGYAFAAVILAGLAAPPIYLLRETSEDHPTPEQATHDIKSGALGQR